MVTTSTYFKLLIFTLLALISTATMAATTPQSPRLEAKSWILLDAQTQQVLASEDADHELPPASLTKLMTLYLLFEDIKLGRLNEDENVRVSEKAWKIGGSTMFLDPRMSPKAGDLIHGISTFSGNDACIAMAEHVSGSEEAFAMRMNEKAAKLGMTHSHFINATGFPAKDHYSSAGDMAKLAAALWRDFPDHYKLFSEKSFTYDGRTQWNRNRLLWTMPEVDGLKTGHTDEAGYCLVSSAQTGNTRFVSAVFGTSSDKARQQQSAVLLKYGFRNFVTIRPTERDLRRQVEVYGGKEESVWLKPENAVMVTVPKGYENQLTFRLQYETPLMAPIAENQPIGIIEAVVKEKNGTFSEPLSAINMVATRHVEEASWIGQRIDVMRLWWQNKNEETNNETAPEGDGDHAKP
ncbi:MAG: D-alanyl-D-alanine carboxypeptidase [Zetaproteobacteria bacterium]|nr:D-alanyl-D-alanine carboxypeptidase [Zetaproteobacteria bacterium]